MKILITGGGGVVGKNLVRVMIEEGVNPSDITVIDKNDKGLAYCRNFGVKTILADLAEKGEWADVFQGQDVIVSLHAQISDPKEEPFIRNNITATQRVVEAARRAGVQRILHYSTAAVISVRQDYYASTKKQGEKIVKASGLNYIILRPSLMYGLHDNKNIGWLIDFARKVPTFPIPGHGKYPRQPIYIDDICRLTIKMINQFPVENKIYSINGKDIVYFKEMIQVVLKKMGGWRFPIYIPIPIFLFLVRIYDVLFGSPFTQDQIKSLVSGDVFPDYPWWDEFGIEITPFERGVGVMVNQKLKN